MKNKFVFAGLVAAGAAGLQSSFAEDAGLVSPKFWNVSGSLRGFYDDNYNIANSGATKKGSTGGELVPTITINQPFRQTDINIRYTYGLYYYQDRQDLNLNAIDQTHQADVWLDHAFSERWKAQIKDTFTVGSMPELISPTTGTTYRIQGDNIANHATLGLDTEWTRLLSTALHYGNGIFDYQKGGATALDFLPAPPAPASQLMLKGAGGVLTPSGAPVSGSGKSPANYAGALNRLEQSIGLDLKWNVQPNTVAFIGYEFSWVNYTADAPIAAYRLSPLSNHYFIYHSADRDNVSHYAYLGLEHSFSTSVSGSVRGGASFTDSYNDPLHPNTSFAPYADMSLSYSYSPGSYIQLGFTHDINATDVATVSSSGHLTQYTETSVLYASINHRITQKLSGSLIGRFQDSSYVGGSADNNSDQDYNVGVSLRYEINRHFSLESGYNYDDLIGASALTGRSYQRNRLYLGLAANF
ncbi:MAG: outer membrane beta-barrel protein [Verrucomicrobiota bacterium]